MRINELISVTISIPPREIEELLDALAQLPHHINPALRYEEWVTHVDFPAWHWWLADLRDVLAREGFHAARLRYSPAIESASLLSGDACRTKQLSH